MNNISLLGRLTNDTEMRYTKNNNTLVASFTLAVNRSYVPEGEERKADFIKIIAWAKTAEFCGKYFKKGQQIALTGRLQTRSWTDDNDQNHYITEVVAENVYFADSNKNNQEETTPVAETEGEDNICSDDELPF